MPQQIDPSFWALLTGLPLLAIFVLALLARRKQREKSGLSAPPQQSQPVGDAPPDAPRRRPVAPPTPSSEHELASAVRSVILRTVAERAPAGWTILVLCPPPHAAQMTWHIHLAPRIAVDVPDGRSIPVNPPAPSHEWRLPGGRRVGVGEGDLEPAPVADAGAIRVAGPYLQVTVLRSADQPPVLVARVEGSPDGSPELRAAPNDLKASQAALREGVEFAVGTRMLGTPPTLGYRLAAWSGHERVWLTIGSG